MFEISENALHVNIALFAQNQVLLREYGGFSLLLVSPELACASAQTQVKLTWIWRFIVVFVP